jgi:hypothetical protein
MDVQALFAGLFELAFDCASMLKVAGTSRQRRAGVTVAYEVGATRATNHHQPEAVAYRCVRTE